MIQTLEDMIRRFCAYGLQFKDSDGFTHDLCTLIPSLELTYKTSVHFSTGQTPDIFKIMLEKVKHHAKKSMNDAFNYSKHRWDKSHKVPDFKVADLVLVSTLNFNNIKGPKKLKDSYVRTFVIVALHGINAGQVELSAEKEFLPLRNPTPLTVPPVEQNEDRKIKKFIKKWRLRGKN
ncbi:hypothetical protein O181_114454 [Austropuccinia psidii MF-1]|uniref:Uncharacterized protein n=1 Tax=Austropuccinia psidii MF-1 TaxID=1389203 RepID=A0A9Q3K5D4_9BASI|nr:hypothetical protein [Austropuccinia psidii MF-1]